MKHSGCSYENRMELSYDKDRKVKFFLNTSNYYIIDVYINNYLVQEPIFQWVSCEKPVEVFFEQLTESFLSHFPVRFVHFFPILIKKLIRIFPWK